MDYLQQETRGKPLSFKLVGQLFLIIAAEIIIFIASRHFTISNGGYTNQNHSTLVLVQIVFRHGERTPMTIRVYPNDPYVNETFEPYGPESLTRKGEETMYELGKFLRTYYGNFLGEYRRGIIYSQTSSTARCKISLLLTLASLFPPSKERQLRSNLNWQPLEYHSYPQDTDYVFYNMVKCTKLVKLRDVESGRIIKNNEVGNISEIAQYLGLHAGFKIKTVFQMLNIYDILLVQDELGLKLPKWTEKIFPNPLKYYSSLEFGIYTKTDELKRLSAGFLLKEMMDAIRSKLQNTSKSINRKIHLYSGHDYNILNFLGMLGITTMERSPYGSFVSLELHKLNNHFGVKIIYHDNKSVLPRVLKLPECQEICPIETFFELYGKYEATADMC